MMNVFLTLMFILGIHKSLRDILLRGLVDVSVCPWVRINFFNFLLFYVGAIRIGRAYRFSGLPQSYLIGTIYRYMTTDNSYQMLSQVYTSKRNLLYIVFF